MRLSVFDLFSIGIGPSSSHTVGPMRAAQNFAEKIIQLKPPPSYAIRIELYGSLALTGKAHGSEKALLLGLEGERPEHVDITSIPFRVEQIKMRKQISLNNSLSLIFDPESDVIYNKKELLPHHSNGMKFQLLDHHKQVLIENIYYSVGGGFIYSEESTTRSERALPMYHFENAASLLKLCKEHKMNIHEIIFANELCWNTAEDIRSRILEIWSVMKSSIDTGFHTEGILPGGLNVKRRAPLLYQKLACKESPHTDPLEILDWVSAYAISVNEVNASGGKVVTAPTNGAAGIIPAIVNYYTTFCKGTDQGIINFFLTAAAIGGICKINASISGAEVGCQGEVGVASSMAAGALTAVLGGTPEQVENAAEIAMEHHLGMTCDPIGGLVQVPCIERNAMGAVKAINASRLALQGDGTHLVSLDSAIKTMKATGADMKDTYKETSQGGLAVNVIEC